MFNKIEQPIYSNTPNAHNRLDRMKLDLLVLKEKEKHLIEAIEILEKNPDMVKLLNAINNCY